MSDLMFATKKKNVEKQQPLEENLILQQPLAENLILQQPLEQNKQEQKEEPQQVQEQVQEIGEQLAKNFEEVQVNTGPVNAQARQAVPPAAPAPAPPQPQYIGMSRKFQWLREDDGNSMRTVREALQDYRLSRGTDAELFQLNKLISSCGDYYYNTWGFFRVFKGKRAKKRLDEVEALKRKALEFKEALLEKRGITNETDYLHNPSHIRANWKFERKKLPKLKRADQENKERDERKALKPQLIKENRMDEYVEKILPGIVKDSYRTATSKKYNVPDKKRVQTKPLETIPDEVEEEEKKVSFDRLKWMPKLRMIREAGYRYTTKSGAVKTAKKTSPSKKYMQPILDQMDALNQLLEEKLDFSKTKQVQDAFLKVCASCEKYLSRKAPITDEGIARRELIKELFEQVSHESMQFAGKVKEASKHPEKWEADWGTLILESRREVYKDGENGISIKKGGAGTSDVLIIKKDGETKFFKKSEQIPSGNIHQDFDELSANLAASKEQTEKDATLSEQDKKERIEKLEERKYFIGVFNRYLKTKNADDPDLRDLFMTMENGTAILMDLRDRVAASGKNPEIREKFRKIQKEGLRLLAQRDNLKAQLEDDENLSEEKRNQIQGELEKVERLIKNDTFCYLTERMWGVRKNILSHGIATGNAGISEKDDLTKRNVAATRIAELFGVSDLIVGSKMTEIEVDGQKLDGIMMDEAKGSEIFKIFNEAKENGIEFKYSPEAFRQLINLQVLDLICGQVDRHQGNYLCTRDENYVVKSISGIDNDMAFGSLSYSTIKKTGRRGLNRIRNVELNGEMSLPAMDRAFANRLLAIKPEMIHFALVDLIAKKDRDALIGRLQGVQNVIRRQMKKEESQRKRNPAAKSKFLSNPKEWAERLKEQSEQIIELRKQFEQAKKEFKEAGPNQYSQAEENFDRAQERLQLIDDTTYLDSKYFL
ncbi:MAG: hypothetical protein IJ679_02270 [Lachnospiraceae bacterium]|nr:hypothetical protein [Lachnospiraceae bacterium]